MPRPSLSVRHHLHVAAPVLVSPGLMPRPSLSVVAAIDHARSCRVSPGLMPRPSLSEPALGCRDSQRHDRVAGVDAPAFVERWRAWRLRRRPRPVSPGLMPRPSLSAGDHAPERLLREVSPGLMPRPSLSVWLHRRRSRTGAARVAGVDAPAFVERAARAPSAGQRAQVAGVPARGSRSALL